MYILKVPSVPYTSRKNRNVKKISFRQNKRRKKTPSFFFRELQLITVLLLNLLFLYDLKHKVRLSKSLCQIFYFQFCLVFIKVYIFGQQIAWTL